MLGHGLGKRSVACRRASTVTSLMRPGACGRWNAAVLAASPRTGQVPGPHLKAIQVYRQGVLRSAAAWVSACKQTHRSRGGCTHGRGRRKQCAVAHADTDHRADALAAAAAAATADRDRPAPARPRRTGGLRQPAAITADRRFRSASLMSVAYGDADLRLMNDALPYSRTSGVAELLLIPWPVAPGVTRATNMYSIAALCTRCGAQCPRPPMPDLRSVAREIPAHSIGLRFGTPPGG
jgi:hypothetical protein